MTDTLERPTSNEDREGWKAYWAAQGMPWRTEPEIDEERQWYLSERRAVQPDIEKRIYPFRDENGSITLNRADVEWLLARHEAGRQSSLDLRGADLQAANLSGLRLAKMLGGLDWSERRGKSPQEQEMAAVNFVAAELARTDFRDAILGNAHFEEGDLFEANFTGAMLYRAHLEHVDARTACFIGANLRRATMSAKTELDGAQLATSDGRVSAVLADIRWEGANLSAVEWAQVKVLGDELAIPRASHLREPKLRTLERAVRAYRQLVIQLRDTGLNGDADRFAYRAQLLQRRVLRMQHHYLHAFGSWLLDLISGYGYRPLRSLLTYVVVVLGFAAVYFLLRENVHPALSPVDAVIFSITSFHGRGFSPGESVTLHNPLTIFAAIEAIIGLLIEITFIATFTQRFFAR